MQAYDHEWSETMREQDQPVQDSGFVLPPPEGEQPATETPPTQSETAVAPLNLQIGHSDTSSRDLMIGGGILAVLLVAYFFARASYANMLVRKRLPPGKANAAGWWLFIFLASLSTGVVLAVVNPAKFLAPLTIGPLGAVSLLALVLMLVSSRR